MHVQLNLSIVNPGYNELPDITNIELKNVHLFTLL